MARHQSFPCTLGVDYSGGTGYTNIGQVRDITGPSISRNEIEVPADHDATGNFMQYFYGVSDPGELTFDLNLDINGAYGSAHIDAGSSLLASFGKTYNGTELPAWQFMNTGLEGTATWTFDGGVTAMDFDMGAVEGSLQASLTVKLTGVPTLTIT